MDPFTTSSCGYQINKTECMEERGITKLTTLDVVTDKLTSGESEESKENVPTGKRKNWTSNRIPLHTPKHFSPNIENGKTRSSRKSWLRPNYKETSQSSSDEDDLKTSTKKRSVRNTKSHPNYKDHSSGNDSHPDYESMEESWISEIKGVDPIKKTPIKLNLKRVRSSDLLRSSTKRADNDANYNVKNLEESPKRKRDDGDMSTSPVRDEKSATNSACTPKRTCTSKAKSMATSGGGEHTPSDARQTRAAKASIADQDGASTPRSLRLRRSSALESLGARRSARFVPTEQSNDFMADKRKALLPRSTGTRRSCKAAKFPSASAGNCEFDAEGVLDIFDGESTPKESKTPRRKGKTPNKKTGGNLTPAMPKRSSCIPDASCSLDVIRANLHVSAVPKSLPCREKEFNDIYSFVGGKISDSAGGCMYISGMPGTGKTATVHAVVRRLEQDVADGNLPEFQYVEVNGLRLTEPRQVFVRILQLLTGEKCSPQHAQEILSKKFTSAKGCNKAVLLLVDEVDMLRNRRQDVVYTLFDWPSKARSKLIVLTIANTMDLPERLLMGRVTSRLGLTRLSFQPYNFNQLEEIVTARLQGSDCFNSDAVQMIARKVAAVSGDARRALDICRRATELLAGQQEHVTMAVVNRALKHMMNSPGIKTVKACSYMERLFLRAVTSETKRTGIEETKFNSVYRQLKSICDFEGIKAPNVSQSLGIVNRLGSSRILLTEHGKADIMQTICLNVNIDDIHYAISEPGAA